MYVLEIVYPVGQRITWWLEHLVRHFLLESEFWLELLLISGRCSVPSFLLCLIILGRHWFPFSVVWMCLELYIHANWCKFFQLFQSYFIDQKRAIKSPKSSFFASPPKSKNWLCFYAIVEHCSLGYNNSSLFPCSKYQYNFLFQGS